MAVYRSVCVKRCIREQQLWEIQQESLNITLAMQADSTSTVTQGACAPQRVHNTTHYCTTPKGGSEEECVPPQDEDGGDGGQEVPGIRLTSEQPVHLHGAGLSHPQVLVVVGHLLGKHDSKVACKQGMPGQALKPRSQLYRAVLPKASLCVMH